MKVKASIKCTQPGDQIVRRGAYLYRINPKNPRRKMRQARSVPLYKKHR